MKKLDIALAIGLVLAIFLSSFTGFAKDCAAIRSGSLRLHILANSDSEPDQQLKLRVRDAILAQSPKLFLPASTKEEARLAAENELPLIEQVAKREILNAGYDYDVRAEIVNMYFETRDYDGLTMPAGRYDAVRIYIGEAKGHNWWCVLFPPLCIPAAVEKQPVEEQLEHLGEAPRYVPKLAVLAFFEKLMNEEKEKPNELKTD